MVISIWELTWVSLEAKELFSRLCIRFYESVELCWFWVQLGDAVPAKESTGPELLLSFTFFLKGRTPLRIWNRYIFLKASSCVSVSMSKLNKSCHAYCLSTNFDRTRKSGDIHSDIGQRLRCLWVTGREYR